MSSDLLVLKYYERLPRTVLPILYKLHLKPNLEEFTFLGKEAIKVRVNDNTDQVIINALEIEIQETTYTDIDGRVLKGQVTYLQEEEKVLIKFDDRLKLGHGCLTIVFTGILNDKLKGFYRSKYIRPDGTVQYAAVTQFSPTSARRAFPCWDEPSFKAKFEVTIIAPKDRTVLSNTEEVNVIPHSVNPDLKIVQFAPTPVMSTYIVGFIVGEFDYIEKMTNRGTRIRVYTPLNKKHRGEFTLDIAPQLLSFLENFFNIPYPLNKLDQVAIPDFYFSAMENWGLITYREKVALHKYMITTLADFEENSFIMAHETAHQWFGNLVTMEWWSDLWLKEGFATYMGYMSLDDVCPQFFIWYRFIVADIMRALAYDSYRHSHPIEIPVNHPDDIATIFDAISYSKGAAVIGMCYNWIGGASFSRGIYNYLVNHAYGNAVTRDLWEALEDASNLPVGEMMSTWTKQVGYPVLKVSSKQDGKNRILTIEQQKFSIDGSLTDEEKQMTWMIPIDVITSKDINQAIASTLLTTKSCELIVPDVPEGDWIKLNTRVTCFYRVNYSPEIFESLKAGIASKKVGEIDRLNILIDYLAFMMSGDLSFRDFLSLLASYTHEKQFITWIAIDACFTKLGLLLEYTNSTKSFNQLGIKFYSKMFEKLGFYIGPDDNHIIRRLRSLVLERMGLLKHECALREARNRYSSCFQEGFHLHTDLRDFVYRTVASSCDNETFASFFEAYRYTDFSQEKVRILKSMGLTQDVNRIKKVLEFSFSSEVRDQDRWFGVVSVAGSKVGRELAWKFFKDHYGSLAFNGDVIMNITSNFASEEMAQEVENFFEQASFSRDRKAVLRAVQSIRTNAAWLRREAEDVEYLLNSMLQTMNF